MARRSQCSSAGDNPLDPNYLPPHYREEYRLAIDALVEDSLDGYLEFLHKADVVDFLSPNELQYIQSIVQPPRQSLHPEQQFLDCDGEGSSDTYWPIHSDLDVPGLDLGWPQVHHFIEPTEVTTLVNPPEPDMPSIKEQARRLIKNAQQVIAVVMDMFTDVDIFADILNAAGRRVAVYILLDEQNADHFVNMVANCRVNLQAFPFVRVRTVSGITYQCRSGKSFKGQMMDRFLLTDCRAVLSGNYSFMWSFEKLHRCMAHLFLGQLVTTFDEEFRILFAQSQPLNVEIMLSQMEELSLSQKRHLPSENPPLYREPKRFLSMDVLPDDRAIHLYDEPMDGNPRMMALKRQGSLRGPADMYNRFGSQQLRVDPGFDQGPRMLMTDNPALKRHSYAEDVPGRYSFPYLPQQGVPDSDPREKLFLRGQQPFPGPAPEEEYSSYNKFWDQGYLQGEQYPAPGLQQDVPAPEFDPVLNYLSSTMNPDYDQGPDKLLPPADLSFTSSHPKRLGIGQPKVCQTSPTPSNSAGQKPFYNDPTENRKDPTVKQKLRNWRIGSYLSACDNPEEEGLPMGPTAPADPFEGPLSLTQQPAPGADLSGPKIPNVKEFKVPHIPRISQMPSYGKATQEKPKKVLDEPASALAETRTTPMPSETAAEVRKKEEEDQKRPGATGLQRNESFRRKCSAAMQRSSRLRSSLIFSHLDQQNPQETPAADQDDEGRDRDKSEQTELPLVSKALGQRKPATREPIEWSRYIKPTSETLKPDLASKQGEDKDSSSGRNSQDVAETPEANEPLKHAAVEQHSVSPTTPQAKLPGAEAPRTHQPVQPTQPLPAYVDMNDPDDRLMFFKELAAKRRAAKAAEAQKEKEKTELKAQPELQITSVCQKEEALPKESPGTSTAKELVKKPVVKDSNSSKPSDEEKTGLDSQSVTSVSVSAETDEPAGKPLQDPTASNPLAKQGISPLMPRSKPIQDELPKTDQTVHLSNPSLLASSYMDMNDPDHRLMFFKELAAKRKASEANKAKEKTQTHPQSEPLTTSGSQAGPDAPEATLESIKPSTAKGSPVENTTASTERADAASPSLKDSEDTSKQDGLFKTDSSTFNTSEEQAPSVPAESEKTGLERQSAEGTEPGPSKSAELQTGTEPSVENQSPKQANAALSAPVEDGDQTEPLPLDAVSVAPSSVEGSSTSDPQNTEVVQPETTICPPPPPSEAETTLQVGTVEPPEQSSTPDTPPPDLGLQNHPAAAEETSVSDPGLEANISTNGTSSVIITSTPGPDADEIKAQETVSSSQQESSESSGEPLQNSDTRDDPTPPGTVPPSAPAENTSVADATDAESDVSVEKRPVDQEPNELNLTTETNRDESSADVPSVDVNVPESGQEESAAEEGEALESPEDAKADSTSPPVCTALPDPGLPGESGPEDSVSGPDSEKTALSIAAPGEKQPEDAPLEPGSESCNASQLETAEPPQDTPVQTAPPSDIKLTDVNAPPAAEALSSESDPSGLDPDTNKSDTSVPAVPNLSDANCISTEIQPKSEEAAQSLSGPGGTATVAPAEAHLPCKTSEVVAPESQTAEPGVPEESSKNRPEIAQTDEKKSNNLEEPSTRESANKEKTREQPKPCPETTEVPSKQAKPSQSRYHSSTANVLSSSNLRDDTKLLLEQISAQSQSRNEATKDSPVTDDEKEDKADKNAKNEKDWGCRVANRSQTKTPQEREKLLEKIQSMRKERRVYSRFEMAP
uniref:Protein FAM83H n=1 Tax=Fundulus heteroclitus TaxID=8078 RepID=A0A3Q2UMC2_FUNHE